MFFILCGNVDPAGGGSPWQFVRQTSTLKAAEEWVEEQKVSQKNDGWRYNYVITQKVG